MLSSKVLIRSCLLYTSGLQIGRPFESFPTLLIARHGLRRFRFLISLICPKPFGSLRRLLFLFRCFLGFIFGCNGNPQWGQETALSLTCNSHSGHFISIIITFPIDLLLVIIYHKCRNVNSYIPTFLISLGRNEIWLVITNQFAPNVEGSLNTTIMFKDWYGRNSETKNG